MILFQEYNHFRRIDALHQYFLVYYKSSKFEVWVGMMEGGGHIPKS